MQQEQQSNHWVARRDMFGSDVIIVATIIAHISKAIAFVTSHDADWPIGMHFIRIVFHHNNHLAAAMLLLACVGAIFGEWANGQISKEFRILVLFPLQFTLIMISFIGVCVALWLGQFPCADLACTTPLPMPRVGLYIDQMQRLFWAGLYLAAVYARVRHP